MSHRLRRGTQARTTLPLVMILGAAALIGTGPLLGAGPSADSSSYRSVDPESAIGGITPDEYVAQEAVLHGWLARQIPAGAAEKPIVLNLTRQERAELRARQESSESPAVVGRTKPVMEIVRFSLLDSALISPNPHRVGHGVLQTTPDGGFVWATTIRSEDAGGLRVHLTRLNLPSDVDLFLLTRAGQAFGPWSGTGPNGTGEFWSNTVFGSEGVLMLRHYGPNGAADLPGISFVIADVGHIVPRFMSVGPATESFCSFNVPCIENASCHNGTPAEPAKSAVALMQWIAGQFIYTCTGGLIADSDNSSQIPYFLTANHCISTSGNATNLETYFQFSISCGSTSCPSQTNPGGIQRLGSTVKTTGSAGDFTLLQLNQAPPAGSVFLGWNNTPVANTNNAPLYRISHPAWAPQSYSDQHVDTSAPTCTGWPRGERIYSRTDVGGTEGGSSGSPVVNGSGQIVGQLSGACGTNVNNACDNVNNATVDGAFAYYWPSVQPFLGTSCVPSTEICTDGIDNDCDGFTDCADSNCSSHPACAGGCSPIGASCVNNSDCCSNKCKGPTGRKTCR